MHIVWRLLINRRMIVINRMQRYCFFLKYANKIRISKRNVLHDLAGQQTMAKEMGVSVEEIQQRVNSLAENNPMLGHRGCRIRLSMFALQTRAPYLLRIPFTGRYSVRLNRFWYHLPRNHRYANTRHHVGCMRTKERRQEPYARNHGAPHRYSL